MAGRRAAFLVLLLAAVFLTWWAAGLGRQPVEPSRFFTEDQIARADRYQTPRYLAVVASMVVGLAVLALLAFTVAGDALLRPVRAWPWPLAVVGAVILVSVAAAVARLPISFWRGFLHERAWGFSTQSVGGWFLDWAKGLGISAALGALMIAGLVALIRLLPRAWPLAGAAGAAAIVVLLTYLAPVLFEPIFNRFTPLEDRELAAELRGLADRAGVPVREVLVADASRRTTKENAYVSGFGATKRLVLYDTLLARAEADEVVLVVAHELGHRRARHVEWGTLVAALAAAGSVFAVWALLRWEPALRAARVAGPSDHRIVPFLLLAVAVLNAVSLPPGNWLSRRFERAADRFALTITGDRETYVETERQLALRNLADLRPGPVAYRFLFTHPAPAERIALAFEDERATGGAAAGPPSAVQGP